VRKSKVVAGKAKKDADTLALEKRMSDALGLSVSVDHKDPGGAVHIKYRDLDQLDDIVRRLESGRG
jgi:ParB family transcriptional regulator, chromosome partitioning protein